MSEQLQDDSEFLANPEGDMPLYEESLEAAQTQYSPEPELEELPDDSAIIPAAVPSRIEALTAAIELHPDAPVNYVFRGEALLENNYYAEAAADFERGLELADSLAESANWGYIYRALADRAREGLRQCLSLD
jgi:tetratricopeptide (TPR) repeat protein